MWSGNHFDKAAVKQGQEEAGQWAVQMSGLGAGAEEAAVALRPARAGHVCRAPEGRAINWLWPFPSLTFLEVTKILLFAAQASHHLVPPEVRTLKLSFCQDLVHT